MPELATTIPPKGYGNIRWNDLLKGVYYAIIGQVLYLVSFFVNSVLQEHPHFPAWAEWLPYIKPIALQIGGYLIGKLGVNNVGQIGKRDKEIVHVGKDQLQELTDKVDTQD